MRYTVRLPYLIHVAALLLLAGCALLAAPAHADTKSATYERRDYQVQIQPNGDVQVMEHWQMHFTGGPFQHAFLQIHQAETTGVDFGTIKGAGVTNQIVTQTTDSAGEPERQVAWDFPATQDDTRIFDIPYTIHGPVQLNATQGWFDWHYFDGPSGSPLPITNSLITVMLPTSAATTDLHVQADSPDGAVTTTVVNGTTATAQAGGSVANHALELQIVFPRAELATTVQRPVWQKNDAPVDLATLSAPTSDRGGAIYNDTGNPSSGINAGSIIGGLMSLLLCLGLPLVIIFSLIMGATQHNGGSANRWIGGGRFNGPNNNGPWGGFPPFGGGGPLGGGGGGSMGGGGMSGGGGASGGGGGGGGGSGFS